VLVLVLINLSGGLITLRVAFEIESCGIVIMHVISNMVFKLFLMVLVSMRAMLVGGQLCCSSWCLYTLPVGF
jgi:hypothetical protein